MIERVRSRAFGLVDLFAVIAIVALFISISPSTLWRARELSKRLVCSANLNGIGASAKIYAWDNNGRWMIPAFKRSLIGQQGVDYVNDDKVVHCPGNQDEGEVGWDRELQSESETPEYPDGGTTALSVTRAYWMMVRSGAVTVKQFICPSSGDLEDPTENVDLYYDFTCYENISYGYQVPFGPLGTQPREGMDKRQVVAADKGPWYPCTWWARNPDWRVWPDGDLINTRDPPRAWRPFNSPNHGGRFNGEGQNCLYPDGNVSFQRTPVVGVDNDNIYTLMREDWGTVEGYNRIHGYTVCDSPMKNPYPGQGVFSSAAGGYSSTDSLIYP